jgi:hypothetical protein
MTRSSQLKTALRKHLFVTFTRPFEEGRVNGYVVDISPRFVLVAVVEDGCRFNGFQCFRLSDVHELEVPGKYAAFAEAALRKRRVRRPRKPPVSVASIEDILKSAARAFPLVTIHRERVKPDVCQIGRIVDIHNGRVSLLQINPDATWDGKPETYRITDITRIDFGGDYEQALHLVGGVPTDRN